MSDVADLTLPPGIDSLRPGQEKAILSIIGAYQRGKRLVVLDAPTGSGKTVIAETVRINLGFSGLYVCTTNALVDQFRSSFPYAGHIKGRRHYPTLEGPDDVTCEDCGSGGPPESETAEKSHRCTFCPTRASCPYVVAKWDALRAPVLCTNTAYAMGEMQGSGRLAGRGLGVIDECDVLESTLVDYTAAEVPFREIRRLGLTPAEDVGWVEDRLIPALQRQMTQVDMGDPVKGMRRVRALDRHVGALKATLKDSGAIWQLTDTHLTARPLDVVPKYANGVLWNNARHWLLMSGTVISAKALVESVGWTGPYESVSMPCQFPVENRPVIVRPVVDMKRATYDAGKMAAGIARVILTHPGERVLVHTFSKRLAFDLRESLRSLPQVRSYDNGGRDEALEWFRGNEGAVLLAYSLDRGISLDDDQCRVQVIAKVPYPFLGDRRTKAKSESAWYGVATLRSLLQMTGRIVRSSTDHGTTYILDSGFSSMWRRYGYLAPEWWRESLRVER